MKRDATLSKSGGKSGSQSSSRRHSYTKVLDNRKHPIRGLWRRGQKFIARITVEDDAGRKAVKWVPLTADTPAEAIEAFRTLLVERSEDRLRHIGRAPKFADFVQTYLARLETSAKKPATLLSERGHLNGWAEAVGHVCLDRIKPHHVNAHLQQLRRKGRAARTCNISLVVLRNVLKSARVDGFIKSLPVDGIPWMKTEKKSRRLYTREDIDKLCAAAFQTRQNEKGETVPVTKNAQQFADYIKLLAACGARRDEALKIRWPDVDFEKGLLTIGADADTKNRECRHVDFNTELEAHLKEMYARRAPDSTWLFPSPQRGERDIRAQTFRESLELARVAAGMPDFAFHDCRHHFISYGVMSGIDYMTLARWVGHKDGGVLIGKVYGHLANEHTRAQAARMNFGPTVLPTAAASA
jgi:integrase